MAQPEIVKDIDARVKIPGDTMTGLLKTNGSIENQGEARFSHPTYCPNIEDTAVGIGCAFKASRGHFNQMNVNEIYLPATATTNYESNKILFKSYSSGNNGTYTGVSEIAQINTTGLKVGSSNIGINGYIEGTWLRTTSAGNKAGDFAIIDDSGWIYKRTPVQVLSDIGAASKSHNHNSKYIKKSGDTMTGSLYIKVMDNQILLGNDEYKKTILRSDGSNFWLLVSDVGSNEFNDLRPFGINLSSGQVYTSHGLNITGGTFNYSSIQSGSSNADRNVWFSTSSNRGTPCFNDNFKYNPSTNTLTVGNVKGTISSSYYLKGRTYWESWANNGNYSGVQYLQGSLPSSTTPTANKVYLGSSGEYSVISAPSNTYQNGGTNNPCNVMLLRLYWGTTYFREFSSSPNNDTIMTRNVKNGSADPWRRLWQEGDAVTGAVWNDYAEYRESDLIEPGYCLIENGDDTLSKSTERMQAWAGISSDTWGFAQGQTEKAQTPIAVAGRVLVYPYRDRNEYKSGDCVCTAPDGKVDIMTEEEIYKHPDRIIGVVSCVPDYDEWGGGENADRPSVKVDGRIWVRVK